ncbi:hypothetical protein L1049_018339 [Liquidambar formosana]|uniref:Uncharacterized protein n=1 Tax=Liquidambar formosana TaxID=63359 RepID=A0AAP0R9X7_LIQFO
MAATSSTYSLISMMALFITALALIGAAQAADAPAPAPASSAGGISPPFALACVVTFVAALFGSVFKM